MLLSLQIYCHLIAPISVFASSVLMDWLLHLYMQTMHNIILIDKVSLFFLLQALCRGLRYVVAPAWNTQVVLWISVS